jgi:hypothetical protein
MSKLDESLSDAMQRMLANFDTLEFEDKLQVIDRAIKLAAYLSKKGGKGKFGEGLDTDDTED